MLFNLSSKAFLVVISFSNLRLQPSSRWPTRSRQ